MRQVVRRRRRRRFRLLRRRRRKPSAPVVHVTAFWEVPGYEKMKMTKGVSKKTGAYLSRFCKSRGWQRLHKSGASVIVLTDVPEVLAGVKRVYPGFDTRLRTLYERARAIEPLVHPTCPRKNGRQLQRGVGQKLAGVWFGKFCAMAEVSEGLEPGTKVCWTDFGLGEGPTWVDNRPIPPGLLCCRPRGLAQLRAAPRTFGGRGHRHGQLLPRFLAGRMACRACSTDHLLRTVLSAASSLGTRSKPRCFDEEVAIELVRRTGSFRVEGCGGRRAKRRAHKNDGHLERPPMGGAGRRQQQAR